MKDIMRSEFLSTAQEGKIMNPRRKGELEDAIRHAIMIPRPKKDQGDKQPHFTVLGRPAKSAPSG